MQKSGLQKSKNGTVLPKMLARSGLAGEKTTPDPTPDPKPYTPGAPKISPGGQAAPSMPQRSTPTAARADAPTAREGLGTGRAWACVAPERARARRYSGRTITF